jgi:DNA primase
LRIEIEADPVRPARGGCVFGKLSRASSFFHSSRLQEAAACTSFVPIRPGPDVDEVLGFAQSFAARLASAHPKELTVEHSIAARGSRVYVDPFRNGFAQTVVAPYSVRRRPHAPVSMPLDWSDLKASLDPASFNIGNFQEWSKRKDPWKDFFRESQDFKPAAALLAKL